MNICELFEDSWTGPDDQWHSQSTDPWHNGNDEWHGEASGNMAEDFNVANLVTTESASISDIVTARELIGKAIQDPINEKHKYFEFLKHLRNKHGAEYSTSVHQKAAKLAQSKVN